MHSSHRRLKQWAREVIAVEPAIDSQRPLKWPRTPIIFDEEDGVAAEATETPTPTRETKKGKKANRDVGKDSGKHAC